MRAFTLHTTLNYISLSSVTLLLFFFFFQAEDGIRDVAVTGVQTCALPISPHRSGISHQSIALDADAGSGPAAWASIWVLSFGLHQSKSRTSPCLSRYMECIAMPLFTGARTSLLASRARALRVTIAKMMATGPAFVSGRTTTCTT